MSPNVDARPTVLIVDDEQDVADAYALKLQHEYETRVAYGGEEALDAMDDDVDAVLLDRRMPGLSGDEVLAELRDRGYDCPVIMATAVDPDLNILEMDFDDYLCKPIVEDTLRDTLEQHLPTRPSRDPRLEEYFAIVSKLEVLEDEMAEAELAESDEYETMRDRAAELEGELEATISDFDDLVDTFLDIHRGSD